MSPEPVPAPAGAVPFVPGAVGAATGAPAPAGGTGVPVGVALPAVGPDDGGPAQSAARAAGWAAGYAAGARRAAEVAAAEAARAAQERAAAEERRRAEHAAALAALDRATRAARDREAAVLVEAERGLHAAALELAAAVLGVELADGARSARAALARVLEHPQTPDAVTVHLHPRDLQALAAEQARTGTALPEGVRLEPDPALQPGDALARHPHGYLDARLATALERARAALDNAAHGLAPLEDAAGADDVFAEDALAHAATARGSAA
jgi:flagellar assembly protein FliH